MIRKLGYLIWNYPGNQGIIRKFMSWLGTLNTHKWIRSYNSFTIYLMLIFTTNPGQCNKLNREEKVFSAIWIAQCDAVFQSLFVLKIRFPHSNVWWCLQVFSGLKNFLNIRNNSPCETVVDVVLKVFQWFSILIVL